ncbi:hypothetical protein [Glycomyces terrestris]|uniref:Uncharacterized protein n=1 Tax=Glycomyces terrestris TaxID=2493553 RepID=A0A426UX04_9ACTN|nr:hypothetical protein [Glycomyces terrestris]RRR99127.1 hypothetical protein EIW28_10275 [Glycomyces terrestris]
MRSVNEVDRVAALALAVQRSAMLPLEEQAALLDTYRRARERVLRHGSEDDVRRLAGIDGAVGPERALSRP